MYIPRVLLAVDAPLTLPFLVRAPSTSRYFTARPRQRPLATPRFSNIPSSWHEANMFILSKVRVSCGRVVNTH